jgi:hypothetical protein
VSQPENRLRRPVAAELAATLEFRRLCVTSGLMMSGAINSVPATIRAMASPTGVFNNSSTSAEASIVI